MPNDILTTIHQALSGDPSAMTSEDSSFASLKRILHIDHGEHAAEAIVERFASRLVAFAAAKMSAGLQRRVGPEDIVQSVFATFFRRIDDKRLEIRDWESLWGLLVQIALCRIYRHAERNHAARRDTSREVAFEDGARTFDREPRPDESAIVNDICEKLLDGMAERYRPIVRGILQGDTHESIAADQGTSLSTVERVHRRAKERLRDLLGQSGTA